MAAGKAAIDKLLQGFESVHEIGLHMATDIWVRDLSGTPLPARNARAGDL
jgi:hypothetical protein